jgi:Fe-S-cluster containining protein
MEMIYYVPEDDEWRTRVEGDRCVFLRDNRCLIHDDPHYPSVCRSFPWVDVETGGPYQFDRSICPEFILRPELNLAGRPGLEPGAA